MWGNSSNPMRVSRPSNRNSKERKGWRRARINPGREKKSRVGPGRKVGNPPWSKKKKIDRWRKGAKKIRPYLKKKGCDRDVSQPLLRPSSNNPARQSDKIGKL